MTRLICLLALLAASAFAQGITLKAHTLAAGATALTTSAIDTTGANFLVVSLTYFGSGTVPALSDSKSNTWHALTVQADAGGDDNVIYYAANPAAGTGHTFSTAGAGNMYNVLAVAAFSGLSSSPLETQAGTTAATSTTAQPGSLAANAAGDLILAVFGNAGSANSVSINLGFTITDSAAYAAGTNFGGGMAFLVASGTSPVNPTWTSNNAVSWALSIASFSQTSAALTVGGPNIF